MNQAKAQMAAQIPLGCRHAIISSRQEDPTSAFNDHTSMKGVRKKILEGILI